MEFMNAKTTRGAAADTFSFFFRFFSITSVKFLAFGFRRIFSSGSRLLAEGSTLSARMYARPLVGRVGARQGSGKRDEALGVAIKFG